MSKKTDALLNKAKAVENPSQELLDAIEVFEGVEGITANHAEYDVLQDLMVVIDAEAEDNTDKENGVDGSTEPESEDNDDSDSDSDDAEAEEDEVDENQPQGKPVNTAGIRMIGALWYHADDNYTKGFASMEECAEHFNG